MIVADESLNARVIRSIRQVGLHVYSIAESQSGITDFEVLQAARVRKALLISEDKDFGTWVFAHHVKDIDVVLLRYAEHQEKDTIATLVQLLANYKQGLRQQFITIVPGKIRHRYL
jgi:predicted nuclease of predicted toxin-antitoxin system